MVLSTDKDPDRCIAAVNVGYLMPRRHQNKAGRVFSVRGEFTDLTAGFVENVLVVHVQLVVYICIVNEPRN